MKAVKDLKSYIIKLHDVAVPNLLQNGDLTVNSLQISVVLDLLLLQNLDCNLHNTVESSLSDLPSLLLAREFPA